MLDTAVEQPVPGKLIGPATVVLNRKVVPGAPNQKSKNDGLYSGGFGIGEFKIAGEKEDEIRGPRYITSKSMIITVIAVVVIGVIIGVIINSAKKDEKDEPPPPKKNDPAPSQPPPSSAKTSKAAKRTSRPAAAGWAWIDYALVVSIGVLGIVLFFLLTGGFSRLSGASPKSFASAPQQQFFLPSVTTKSQRKSQRRKKNKGSQRSRKAASRKAASRKAASRKAASRKRSRK